MKERLFKLEDGTVYSDWDDTSGEAVIIDTKTHMIQGIKPVLLAIGWRIDLAKYDDYLHFMTEAELVKWVQGLEFNYYQECVDFLAKCEPVGGDVSETVYDRSTMEPRQRFDNEVDDLLLVYKLSDNG